MRAVPEGWTIVRGPSAPPLNSRGPAPNEGADRVTYFAQKKEAVMFERMARYENPLLGQMRRLEQELDDFFGTSSTLTGTRDIRSLPAGTFPAVNVGATPEEITVYLFAPGLDARKL